MPKYLIGEITCKTTICLDIRQNRNRKVVELVAAITNNPFMQILRDSAADAVRHPEQYELYCEDWRTSPTKPQREKRPKILAYFCSEQGGQGEQEAGIQIVFRRLRTEGQRSYGEKEQEWCPGTESNCRHEDFQSSALKFIRPTQASPQATYSAI